MWLSVLGIERNWFFTFQGGSTLRNKSKRFVDQLSTVQEYDVKKECECQSGGIGKLYLCPPPRYNLVVGPSVPTKIDENGYVVTDDGNLLKVPPDKHDNSLGPAFYDVKDVRVKLYYLLWTKSSLKWEVSDLKWK